MQRIDQLRFDMVRRVAAAAAERGQVGAALIAPGLQPASDEHEEIEMAGQDAFDLVYVLRCWPHGVADIAERLK